jgi:hypothetical protein
MVAAAFIIIIIFAPDLGAVTTLPLSMLFDLPIRLPLLQN